MERNEVYDLLRAQGALTVDMWENFNRGNPEILYASENAVYMVHDAGVHMLWATDRESVEKVLDLYPEPARVCVVHTKPVYYAYTERYGIHCKEQFCMQYCYSKGTHLPVSGNCEFRMMTDDDIPFLQEHYKLSNDTEYLKSRIAAGIIWGAYIDGKCAGFIGGHREGSIGMLEVLPEYRRRGIGTDLENFQMNRFIDRGLVPYGQVYIDNDGSHALQQKSGLEMSSDIICWVAPDKK